MPEMQREYERDQKEKRDNRHQDRREINESWNDRGNYVRENTPPPARVRRGGGQPSDK